MQLQPKLAAGSAASSQRSDTSGTDSFFANVSSSDREELLRWNATRQNFPESECLHELISRQATAHPQAGALEHRGARMSYGELERCSNNLASRLMASGVGPGDIIGIFFERNCQAIIGMLGVLKAGAAYLPLDPKYPMERLRFMIEDSGCVLVLTELKIADRIPPTRAVVNVVDEEKLPTLRSGGPVVRPTPCDPAYLIYTSGSTGHPKGVVIEHRSVVNYVTQVGRFYRLATDDRLLQFSSFCFDASVEEIFTPLVCGSTLVLRPDEIVESAGRFFEFCSTAKITALSLPTAYCHELAGALESRVHWPSTVQLVAFGGEQILPDRLAILRRAAGPYVRLINSYGPTEATVAATVFEVPEEFAGQERVSIGRPLGNMEAWVLDEKQCCLPIGVAGELCLGGIGVARGYLNRPELNAGKFIEHPGRPGSRLYRTGDRAAWQADGTLRFLGRVDDQVKVRGFRVELGEVEAALNAHPHISQNVVIAREGSRGEKALVAYYVSGQELSISALRNFLKETIPDYMVPGRFLRLPRLPVTTNGKIDRKALPDVPAVSSGPGQAPPPQNALELQIQLAFERVLHSANVSSETSFFELGGDSLKALQLVLELERATETALPLGVLYETSTVRGLAEKLGLHRPRSVSSSLIPLQPHGSEPPLFFIHTTPGDVLGYGNLIYHLGQDQPCFGLQSLGMVQPERAHQTIPDMARHYVDEMRTVQPHGPYRLCGWCYGGIVAFEMAQILKTQGEKVALLALVDTPAVAPGWKVPAYYAARIQCLFRMTPTQAATYLRYKWDYYRHRESENDKRFSRVEMMPDADATMVAQRNAMLEKLERLYALNMRALFGYQPRPYAGRICLLNASEPDPAKLPDRAYGWTGLAAKIETIDVPGDHDSILKEPNAGVLAGKLKDLVSCSKAWQMLAFVLGGLKELTQECLQKVQALEASVELAMAEVEMAHAGFIHLVARELGAG
jgi:amino acid adenylation domain-containing protein